VDDAGVDLEEVVARHSRLAGHARGDDDEVTACQGLSEAIVRCVTLQCRVRVTDSVTKR
jgi:hypothetical protein